MALCKVNTDFFDVVHTSDPDVSAVSPKGKDSNGSDAENSLPHRWIARSDARLVKDGATVFKVRALSGTLINAGPSVSDPKWRAYILEHGLSAGSWDELAKLPWQFEHTLATFIYEVSTYPLDRAK